MTYNNAVSCCKLFICGLFIFSLKIKQSYSDGHYLAGSMVISWVNNGVVSTNFTMMNSNMKPGSYFAFAFSYDRMMVIFFNLLISKFP